MKNSHFITVVSLLMVLFANLSYAEERTHNPYRITSYNLGAILDNQAFIAVRTNRNFQPLLITSTKADILNNELEGTVSLSGAAPHTTNTRGIALSAQFNASKRISVLGTFGMTKNLWTPDSLDYDNESSWEANLGIVYKLINNFSYEMHFGYMDTGNLFSEHNSYNDVESIIMISNRLTLSF
jgi:hypothetical protein